MLKAHRPTWCDSVPPLAIRFLPFSFDPDIKPTVTDREAFGISSVVDPWHWVYFTAVGTTKRGLIYCFYTRKEAEEYIDRRCSPQPIEPKFYFSTCKCKFGGWDYRVIKDVVYAHCNDCNKPLYEEQLDKINKHAIADIDLNDLLL